MGEWEGLEEGWKGTGRTKENEKDGREWEGQEGTRTKGSGKDRREQEGQEGMEESSCCHTGGAT